MYCSPNLIHAELHFVYHEDTAVYPGPAYLFICVRRVMGLQLVRLLGEDGLG